MVQWMGKFQAISDEKINTSFLLNKLFGNFWFKKLNAGSIFGMAEQQKKWKSFFSQLFYRCMKALQLKMKQNMPYQTNFPIDQYYRRPLEGNQNNAEMSWLLQLLITRFVPSFESRAFLYLN